MYDVGKLPDNWNSYKKESTRPKLTLYLPSVENMVAYIFMMTGNNIHGESFCLTRFFYWKISNIQANSIGGVGVEGLKLVWWCCASARPSFQSSIAVYNHVRWSCITTCFFWIVYFHYGQWTTVIIIITKICIIQNLLTKKHLNGRHHYCSMIWVNANICVPEFSKRS